MSIFGNATQKASTPTNHPTIPEAAPAWSLLTGQKFLRGYQITDANGQVKFTTIYPGWYMGRTIHIHVRVRTYSGPTILSNFVTQIFFDDTVSNTVLATSAYSRSTGRDTTNSNDMVYQTANKERMLATVTGDNNNGYAATITIGAGFQAAALFRHRRSARAA
jgi:protocatechuate 3,4-dioxygenase beta subunit